jgi:15-cis-phytoene synthase
VIAVPLATPAISAYAYEPCEAALERAVRSAGEGQRRRFEDAAAASLVKQRDRDRYWSALFAPAAKRAGLLALYGLNAELTHIAAATSEPMVGQIRLQWWRDAIDLAAPGTKTGNPVADALGAAILAHDLPKERLIRMADARMPEILGEPPADIQALRASLRENSAAVFELGAVILGDCSDLAQQAAEYAGLAYGLTRTLLTLPFQVSRRKLLLPPSYFENRGVDLPAIYRGKTSAAFQAALADLRGAANRALQQFRSVAPELDEAAWPAFLPLTLVKPYLRAMAAPEFNHLQTVASVNPIRRFWRIWRAARLHAI